MSFFCGNWPLWERGNGKETTGASNQRPFLGHRTIAETADPQGPGGGRGPYRAPRGEGSALVLRRAGRLQDGRHRRAQV